MIRLTCTMIALSVLLIAAHGCSSTSNPIEPKETPDILSMPVFETVENGTNHSLLGTGTIHFDLENLTASVEINRNVDMHYNIATMMPMNFTVNSFDPVTMIVNVDVTLTNPYPIDGRDVRLIIYYNSIGHKLINSDSWTDLHDIPAGLPINPFKMYSAYAPGHIFDGETQDTQTCQIYLPGGNPFVEYAIDVSYPNNCEEPYRIKDFVQDALLYDQAGSVTHVEVDVYDWQYDINDVSLYCPAITGVTLVPFTEKITFVWELDLINSTGASAGDYAGVIVATSAGSGSLAMYNFVNITVTHKTHDDGWAATWGGSNEDKVNDVASIGGELIFAVGTFNDTVDFDPSNGTFDLTSNGVEDIFLSIFDSAGRFKDAIAWGGTEDDSGNSIALNKNGEVYVAGSYKGKVDFDPGPGDFLIQSNGSSDAFLSKFEKDGSWLWSLSWGADDIDDAVCLATDGSSNVYVGGEFNGTVDFDPGSGVTEYDAGPGKASYVSKFNAAGDFIWARTWSAANCNDVTVLNDETVLLTGSFSSTVDFDPSGDIEERTTNGGFDVYLTVFSSDGKFLDVKAWGGTSSEHGKGVVIGQDEYIFVTGNFYSDVDFDPGAGEDWETSNGYNDVFLSMFDGDIDYKWVLTWGGDFVDMPSGICADSFGNVYVTGFFEDEVDFDPTGGVDIRVSNGEVDIFLSKLNYQEEFLWANTWGGTLTDKGCSVAVDSDDYLDLAGLFRSTVDFDPGIAVDEHTSSGSEDAFLTRLTTGGEW